MAERKTYEEQVRDLYTEGTIAEAYDAADDAIEIAHQADQEIARLKNALSEWTDWQPGKGIIEPVKPTHGSCCTCQTCGRDHDTCVCAHNEIERLIAADTGDTDNG